jgi:hypothetical protein
MNLRTSTEGALERRSAARESSAAGFAGGRDSSSFRTHQQLTLNAEKRDPESDGDVGAAQLAAQMVTSMADWYKHNEPTLKSAHKAILVAFVAVVVQLACWSGSIIGS